MEPPTVGLALLHQFAIKATLQTHPLVHQLSALPQLRGPSQVTLGCCQVESSGSLGQQRVLVKGSGDLQPPPPRLHEGHESSVPTRAGCRKTLEDYHSSRSEDILGHGGF